MEKQGMLIYDENSRRVDIRFGFEDYYGGLHCGMTMEVLLNRKNIITICAGQLHL